MSGGRWAYGFGSRGLPEYPQLTERFELTKLPTQVDGYALGGGFEFLLACDLVVASAPP